MRHRCIALASAFRTCSRSTCTSAICLARFALSERVGFLKASSFSFGATSETNFVRFTLNTITPNEQRSVHSPYSLTGNECLMYGRSSNDADKGNNPGNREFVAAYQKEFNRAPAVQSANSYAGCQIFAEAVRQAGTSESEKLRDT